MNTLRKKTKTSFNLCLFERMATLVSVALLTGCQTTQPQIARWTGRDPKPAILNVQYATSTGKAGCETAEIYIINPGTTAVTFTNAVLDGVELPGSTDSSARQTARRFRFDIGGKTVAARAPVVDDSRIIWSQFNPCATILPGGCGLFQIGFRDKVPQAGSFLLALNASDGNHLETSIPRCFPPTRQITAVTWAPSGDVVNIQYSRGSDPVMLSINGQPMGKFKILKSSGKGAPGVLMAVLPKPVVRGENFLIELDFGKDGVRLAFLRASPGIVLSASDGSYPEKFLSSDVRRDYGLDDDPAVICLPFDVACDDTRAKKHGNSAPNVSAARLKAYKDNHKQLSGIDFCTALYESIWNIYAPMADAVVVKPYQLHWGRDPARFIESEEEHIATAVAAASPRPVIWVPERFKRNRYVEGEELKVLGWTALMRGARGIRYHYWKNDPKNPFVDCPDLSVAMRDLNRDIRSIRPILSALVPSGVKLDRTHMTSLYEGWSGDAGVLLLVRNMRYTTDEGPNDNGKKPRFRVAEADGVPVSFVPPPWLRMGAIIDPISGEALRTIKTEKGPVSIILPHLGAFRLIWIPNTDSARFQKQSVR